MNCIKDFNIQKFIDGEATQSEASIIENHIKTCEKCEVKVNNQRKLAAAIKKGINLLEKDSIEIPGILIPSKAIKINSSSNRRLIYLIAAASILLFLFVVRPKDETTNQQANSVEFGYSMEVDANRPVSKLPMVISIIDSKGNVTEYFMKQ